MRKKVRQLVSTTLVYGLGSVTGKFIAFFLLPVFTYYLTPEEYGQFETLNVVLLLLTTISISGLDAGLGRFYYDADWAARRPEIVGTTTGLAVLLGATMGAVALAGALATGWASGSAGIPATAIVLVCVLVPWSVFNTQILALLQARRQAAWHSSITLGRFVVIYGGSVLLLMEGMGVTGVFWSHVAAYAAVGVAGLWLIARSGGWSFDAGAAPTLLRFGIPIAAANVASWVISSSDRFFLLHAAGLEDVGLYSVGSRLASIVGLALAAFQTAWPQFVFALDKEEDVPYTYSRIFTYYVLMGTALALAVTLLAPELLAIMTTQAYAGAERVVLLLCAAVLVTGIATTMGVIPILAKRSLSYAPSLVIPAALNIMLNALFVPRYGMMGAAWVSLATSIAMLAIMYAASRRMLTVQYERRRLGTIALLAAAVLLAGSFVPFEGVWPRLAAKLALLSTVPVVIWRSNFLVPNERITILKVVRRLAPFGASTDDRT